MAKFSSECLRTMQSLTKKLEVSLGPDTGDLMVRIGIHSGPVTAGVLRGERARFQLFGDTMNTASRMESTGQKGRIQVSENTASLLEQAGKGHWLRERTDKVYAKGKGELKTFWLTHDVQDSESTVSHETSDSFHKNQDDHKPFKIRLKPDDEDVNSKKDRLIDWNVDVLGKCLLQIAAHRNHLSGQKAQSGVSLDTEKQFSSPGCKIIDEVKEIISLPTFDGIGFIDQRVNQTMELSTTVQNELRAFVTSIAAVYTDNPFHNFEVSSWKQILCVPGE